MDSKHLPIIIAVVGIGLVYLYWSLNKKNQDLEEQIYYLQAHIQRLTNPVVKSTEPIELEEQVFENENDVEILDRTIEQVDYGYEESDEETEPEPVEETMDTIREITEEHTPAEDIVITKFSHCSHILQSGKNKGSSCGKPTIDDTGFCKHHSAPEPLN